MIVLINGRFVPEEQAVVSVFDRGFLYGDGLFETMRVFRGRPFRWEQHMERLHSGAEFLKLNLPHSFTQIRRWAEELIACNHTPDSLLRLTLTRGVGVRGYSTKGAGHPTLVMSLHPVLVANPENPPRWRAITSSFRVPADEPLMNFKTCNKLPQILARAEAESKGADEALLLNVRGEVAEAASSNLFWVQDGAIRTTPLTAGALAGVTRQVVIELCGKLGVGVKEATVSPADLARAAAVFLSSSALGIVEVAAIDGCALGTSAWVERLRAAYRELLERETA